MPITPARLTTLVARWPPHVRAMLVYGGAVFGVMALHLATNGTLGFHTDELYYLDAGRHPAFGYVDFPPIVPLLARLETGVLGVSPQALRVLPSVLGGFLVALSGAYARRLGGSLRVQALVLLTAVAAPFLLGTNWVFQTVTFDQLTWMVSLYWFLCLVVDRKPRYWIYLAISLGIGLEVKYTITALIVGIAVAVLLTPSMRVELRTRYPRVGAALILAIWAPNLVWQVVEGFPTLTYVANHRGGGPVLYLVEFVVYLLFLLPIWVAGMISLFRNGALRPIGIACAVPLLIFLFGGKSYYAAGTVAIVLAQGVMAISRLRRHSLRAGLEIAVALASLFEFATFAELVLPITPPSMLHTSGLDSKNEVFADSVGWEDIANQVTAIYGSLPLRERQSTVVISAYYGVPGALQVYEQPLVRPISISPQLSDYYWLPDHMTATEALMVDYRPADVAWMCASPKTIAHLIVPYHVVGLEQGAPVTFCQLKAPIPAIWPQLRDFS